MKRILITTAAILGVAAPVFADTQLERSLGVSAGEYSTAQLATLAAVQSKTGNEARVNLGDVAGEANAATNPGSVQLAELVGVNPNDYSVEQVIALASVQGKNGNDARIQLNDSSFGFAAEGNTTGKAQLAATLGVNADDYTLAELVKLQSVQGKVGNDARILVK